MTHGEWLPDSRRVVAIAKEGPGRHAVLLADTTGAQPVQVLHRFASEHDFPGITRGARRRGVHLRGAGRLTATTSCSGAASTAGRWSS